MKLFSYILGLLFLFSVMSCGRMTQHASEADLRVAQAHYDSGFVRLQQDSLMQAFPCFIQVAEKLEYLPEDMTNEEKLLASRAYYQMAYVFRRKMANNAEIDALRWALAYQRMVQDTTWMVRSSLELANAFSTLKESDSARYYHDFVTPYLDTVVGDLNDYFAAQLVLSDLYYNQHQFDSCFMVQRNTIAFKTRRGMSATNDSVSLGIGMYHSPYRHEAKPYLLKVLDMQAGDLELSAIMSLLEQIYEEEGNADSAAFCHSFNKTYVKAESDRVSDGMLAVKQYEQFKGERDARLQALREQKALRKRIITLLWSSLAFVVSVVVVVAIVKRRRRRNASFEAGWAQFEQSDIFVRIRERLAADAPKISSKNVEDFSYLALSQADFVALKDAVDAAFGGFATRLAARYPDLSPSDLNACCLALTGLSHAEMAVLQGVKYNSFTNRITKIKKTLGTEESLPACLKNML